MHRIALALLASVVAVSGCAAIGNSASSGLIGIEWVVQAIDGKAVVEGSRATLRFAPEAGVSGNASCNRFRAEFAASGDALTVSRAVTTRMACADALMQQEARFLGVLADVRRYAIAADGTLTLRTDAGATIVARRS